MLAPLPEDAPVQEVPFRLFLVGFDNWEALFLDGELVEQDHRISMRTWFKVIAKAAQRQNVTHIQIAEVYFDQFPLGWDYEVPGFQDIIDYVESTDHIEVEFHQDIRDLSYGPDGHPVWCPVNHALKED